MALDLSGLSQDQQIAKAAAYARVPESVIRGQWRVESSNGKHMRSSVGARGHFQIMPVTQATWEKRNGRKYNPDDFGSSLELYADIMRENMGLAKGNVVTALRIYHGGTDRRNWGKHNAAYAPAVLGEEAAKSVASIQQPVPVAGDIASAVEGTPLGDRTWSGASIGAAWRGDPIEGRHTSLAAATSQHVGKLRAGIAELALGEGAAAGADPAASVATAQKIRASADVVPSFVQQPTAVPDALDQTRVLAATVGAGQEDRDEAEFRDSLTALDKWGAAFDSTLGAAISNQFAKEESNAPDGWTYNPKEWERPEYTADELEDIRDAAYSPTELAYTAQRIDTRRQSMRVKNNQSGWSSFGFDLAAGFTDPASWATGGAASFGVRSAGVGSAALFAQGRVGAGVASSVGENALASVVTDAALVGAGERRTVADFLADAAFASSIGTAFNLSGIRSSLAARDKATIDLEANNASAYGAEWANSLRERAVQDVGDSNPVVLNNRVHELANEEVLDWIRAGMADVPDDMRLFARPDVPEGAPVVPAVVEIPDEFVYSTKSGQELLLKVTQEDLAGTPVRRINAVDAETGEIALDSLGRPVANLIFGEPGQVTATALGVRVSPEFQRQGIATAMYKIAGAYGADLGDAQTGTFSSGAVSTRSDEGQAFRSGMDTETVQVRPRTAPAAITQAEPAPVSSVFRTNKERKDFYARTGLDTAISDDTTRIQVAEVYARAEKFAAKYNIDEAKLGTVLQRVGLEATSTTLLSSPSPVAKMIGITLLENPEGAAGRHSTAAIDRRGRFESYMGSRPRQWESAYRLWRADVRKSGAVRDFATGWKMRSEFEYEVKLYRETKFNGGNPGEVHDSVKRMAAILDDGYNRMAMEQRAVGTAGSARLPDEEVTGYESRIWLGGKIAMAGRDRRESIRNALKDQFAGVGELYGDEFLDKFATKYLERIEERAAGMQRAPDNLFSDFQSSTLRDTLKALSLNEEQMQKVMGRYSRGGARHTKARIGLDVTKKYTDEGGSFRLMDYLDNRVMDNYRRYAGRVAGDVALAKHGVLGDAGINVLRKAMQVTGANDVELRAFEQVMAEFTGRVVGVGDPTVLANARLLTSAVQLGGAGINQAAEYSNGLPAVGAAGVAEAIKLGPKMKKEINLILSGNDSGNSILTGFEFISGRGTGLAGYDLHMFNALDTQASLYGSERAGFLTSVVQRMSNANRVLSGQRMVLAVQQRGFAQVLIAKGVKFLRDGKEADVALKDMGMDDALLARLRRTQDQVVRWGADGKLEAVDPRAVENLQDRQAWLAFYTAIERGTAQILQDTFIGETGKWAHNGWLKSLFQHRTFSLVAQQKQLGRYVGMYGAWGTAGIIASAMAVAAPLQALRVASRVALLPEDERETAIDENVLSPIALGKATMNYVSATGLLNDVLDVGTGAAGGWYEYATDTGAPDWVRALSGGSLGNRREVIGGQLAPAVGVANAAAQAVQGKPENLADVLPGGRLPYVLPLLKGAAAEFED